MVTIILSSNLSLSTPDKVSYNNRNALNRFIEQEVLPVIWAEISQELKNMYLSSK